MPDAQGLKVFISWSGDLAKQVAIDLRELLPILIDGVAPWVSDRDIGAGHRSLAVIARELDDTAFGIIVTTRENQNSQWLNFEAGALSKRFVGPESSRVVPLLVDMESIAELTGPLTQFQAKLLDRQGFEDTLVAIAAALGASAAVVKRRLANEWDEYETSVSRAKTDAVARSGVQPKRDAESMATETLELARDIAERVGIYASGHAIMSRGHALDLELDNMLVDYLFKLDGVIHCSFYVVDRHLQVWVRTQSAEVPIAAEKDTQLRVIHEMEDLLNHPDYPRWTVFLNVNDRDIRPS